MPKVENWFQLLGFESFFKLTLNPGEKSRLTFCIPRNEVPLDKKMGSKRDALEKYDLKAKSDIPFS